MAPTVAVDKPEVGPLALGSALQEQERIITMSYTLASEASLKSKLVAGQSSPASSDSSSTPHKLCSIYAFSTEMRE